MISRCRREGQTGFAAARSRPSAASIRSRPLAAEEQRDVVTKPSSDFLQLRLPAVANATCCARLLLRGAKPVSRSTGKSREDLPRKGASTLLAWGPAMAHWRCIRRCSRPSPASGSRAPCSRRRASRRFGSPSSASHRTSSSGASACVRALGLISMERVPQIGLLLVVQPARRGGDLRHASFLWPLVNRTYSQGSLKVAALRAVHNAADDGADAAARRPRVLGARRPPAARALAASRHLPLVGDGAGRADREHRGSWRCSSASTDATCGA